MNAKDWFGVAVRIIGLLAIAHGLYDLVTFAMISSNILESSLTSDIHYATLYIGLIYFFIGLYFLRGASLLLDFAYPNEYEEDEIHEQRTETEVQDSPETIKESQN